MKQPEQSPKTLTVHGPGYRGEIVKGAALESAAVDGTLLDLLAARGDGVQRLKRERLASSAIIHRLPGSGEQLESPIFIKQHARRGVIGFVKTLIGRHRAHHAWTMARQLITIGVPAPRPLGYLLVRHGFAGVQSIYFCEAVIGAVHLRDAFDWRQYDDTASHLLDQLAEAIATMHKHGLFHGDLKWTNILVDDRRERFWLVDLDGGGASRASLAAMNDIARFVAAAHEASAAAPATERFLGRYGAVRGILPEELARRIAPLVEKHVARRSRVAGQLGRG